MTAHQRRGAFVVGRDPANFNKTRTPNRMKKFHYATVNAHHFLLLAKVPVPRDSYVSDDPETAAIKHLIASGYRLHSITEGLACFEREFEGLSPQVSSALGHAYDPLDVMRELFHEAQDEFGEDDCNCRPEPENDGHVCAMCKARAILGLFKPPTPEQLPQSEDLSAFTTLPDELP